MRKPIPLLAILMTSALLAAGPATRPAAERYVLHVCRYVNEKSVLSADLTVEADVPFASRTQVGGTTLNLTGTLRPLERGQFRLQLTYDERTWDAKTGGTEQRTTSSTIEPELGREANIGGGRSGNWSEREACSLAPAPRS